MFLFCQRMRLPCYSQRDKILWSISNHQKRIEWTVQELSLPSWWRIEYHTVLCTATRFSLFCRRKKLESADFELRWEQLNILSQLKQECQSESVRHPELPLESGYVCSNFISRIVQWRAWVIRPLMNWPIHKRGCVDRDRYDAMQICPICGFYFLHRRKRWRMIESRPERRDTWSVDYFELLNPVLAGNWNLP